MIPFQPEDMPDEVRAWFEQQAEQAMAAFSAYHGRGEPSDGYLVNAFNRVLTEDEEELTDDQVEVDHARVMSLDTYVKERIPTPDSWVGLSDADKLRVVVMDYYLRMIGDGPGTCVHRDRVQRDVLDIADRLDLATGFGARPPSARQGDTRVSTHECAQVWEGKSNDAHFLGSHWCARMPGHGGRHRCGCGVTTTRKG